MRYPEDARKRSSRVTFFTVVKHFDAICWGLSKGTDNADGEFDFSDYCRMTVIVE